jgi:hypothetical protein
MSKMSDRVLRYIELRDRKKDLRDEEKEINGEMNEIEEEFKEYLDREDCDRATYKGFTVYRTKSIVPKVEDWERFWKYVLRQRADYLIERRPSVTGCRELFQTKGKIPGLEPFEKHKIGVQKA